MAHTPRDARTHAIDVETCALVAAFDTQLIGRARAPLAHLVAGTTGAGIGGFRTRRETLSYRSARARAREGVSARLAVGACRSATGETFRGTSLKDDTSH